MASSVSIDCRTEQTRLVKKAIQILVRILEERCALEAVTKGNADCRIILSLREGIGTDGFTIEDTDNGAVHIVGNDERGLLYGVGKFLRTSRYGMNCFMPSSWRGTSVPAKPVRGVYFATHFHNFYHDAPLQTVERYVEELALWGCNALTVWFDMHHFKGLDAPDARHMIERLRVILRVGDGVGMQPGMITLGNEAYATSPEELRADWTAGHNGYTRPLEGHYRVEICPNKPGGLDFILRLRREMLEAFSDLDIRYVWIWPYDQGGCTCSRCAPWGANGFLLAARAEAELIRQCCPSAKVVLSTWFFDRFTSGEWQGLATALEREKPDWLDYLMADDFGRFPDYPLKHGVPGGLPVLNFPEVSMERMYPWGGFGANPRPAHWQAYWDRVRDLVVGGFPYSEGIYEDINKVIVFQFGWDPEQTAEDIVREYASYEFSPDVADDLVHAVKLMEECQNHSLRGDLADLLRAGNLTDRTVRSANVYQLASAVPAERCFDIMRRTESKIPERARHSWRWRILWLRSALDTELQRSESRATENSESYFDELTAIYHAANAELQVSPPSIRTLKRVLTESSKQDRSSGRA